MYKIVDNTTIYLTRGDSFKTAVQIKNGNSTYQPQQGDKVRFALKRNIILANGYVDEEPLIEKDIPIATMVLSIAPADTKGFSFGEYAYDIELTYSNGEVDTFINNAKFFIVPEVD